MITLIKWFGHLRNVPRQPWIYTLIALLATANAVWQFTGIRRRIARLRQARDGELVVGPVSRGAPRRRSANLPLYLPTYHSHVAGLFASVL